MLLLGKETPVVITTVATKRTTTTATTIITIIITTATMAETMVVKAAMAVRVATVVMAAKVVTVVWAVAPWSAHLWNIFMAFAQMLTTIPGGVGIFQHLISRCQWLQHTGVKNQMLKKKNVLLGKQCPCG